MPNTDEYIGVVISDVARLLRTEFDRRVRRLGITRAQWLVLTRLHRRPGASHSELAEMMEVEKATAGRMIDRLVANGWVERRTQRDDRRVKRVYLTREAERVHKRIWRVAEATVDSALADLSAPESRQLMSLLQRIKKTLEYVTNVHPQATKEFDCGAAVAWHRVPWTLGCAGAWTDAAAGVALGQQCARRPLPGRPSAATRRREVLQVRHTPCSSSGDR